MSFDTRSRLQTLLVHAWNYTRGIVVDGRMASILAEQNVVALPCKPGDTIYHVFPKQGVTERKVKRLNLSENGISIVEQNNVFSSDEIGKTIFFTREDAEVAWEKIKPPTLKPCPFCGGEARIVEMESSNSVERMKISCKWCDATLDHEQLFYVHERRDYTGEVVEVIRESVNESAIEAWNRRFDDGHSV